MSLKPSVCKYCWSGERKGILPVTNPASTIPTFFGTYPNSDLHILQVMPDVQQIFQRTFGKFFYRPDALPVTLSTAVMRSETISLRTKPVWDQKSGLCLGLGGLVLYCETQSCHARRHNDLEGHSNFSSTIYSFSILYLEHRYCGDQQWRSLT